MKDRAPLGACRLFFGFFFLWAPLGALQGENGLSQWPRPENPWENLNILCYLESTPLLITGL